MDKKKLFEKLETYFLRFIEELHQSSIKIETENFIKNTITDITTTTYTSEICNGHYNSYKLKASCNFVNLYSFLIELIYDEKSKEYDLIMILEVKTSLKTFSETRNYKRTAKFINLTTIENELKLFLNIIIQKEFYYQVWKEA